MLPKDILKYRKKGNRVAHWMKHIFKDTSRSPADIAREEGYRQGVMEMERRIWERDQYARHHDEERRRMEEMRKYHEQQKIY